MFSDSDEVIEKRAPREKPIRLNISSSREQLENVRRCCLDAEYPTLMEYDFQNDKTLKTLNIDLKHNAVIRSYQEISLSKFLGDGRAHSGIIVLPCGAGKTLVGITAMSRIKKPTVVVCENQFVYHRYLYLSYICLLSFFMLLCFSLSLSLILLFNSLSHTLSLTHTSARPVSNGRIKSSFGR